MKKFLNRAVAAIATGCFLMPSAECVKYHELLRQEDDKLIFDEESVVKSCENPSMPEPKSKYKLSRSISTPDLLSISLWKEKEIREETLEYIFFEVEKISRYIPKEKRRLPHYSMQIDIGRNLCRLLADLITYDMRLYEMMYEIEKKYSSYCRDFESFNYSPEDDVKKYFLGVFYLNLFFKYFGTSIEPSDGVGMEVLAYLKGMTYPDFREHIDKIGEELVGGILSQIFILKHGNSYKLKLFFRERNTDSEKARVIPVTVLMDLFS